jgi:DNA-binding CsgD family transcriptional regulator
MKARILVVVIAGLTILTNLMLSVNWVLAVAAGVAVAVVGEVVGRLVRGNPLGGSLASTAPMSGAHPLSARELEVAQLVVQGLTSKEVGRRLLIKRGTVDTHVQHIYNKLSIESRPQLAVWLVERGLRQTTNHHDLNTSRHK